MLVSIIIPVYKVEKYIGRCVNSVINQTYRQLEVIFVDDGTPDNSINVVMDVIRSSSKGKDVDWVFLCHDYNRGLSAARNTGLRVATGDYVFFLDSDDEIAPNCIETLVSGSENGKIDVICGGLEYCGRLDLFESDSSFNCIDAYYNGEEAIVNSFILGRIPYSAWNKLLRRDVLVNEKVYFKERLLFEDNLWIFILINSVKNIKTLSAKTYHYWIRPGSIVTSTDYLNRRKNMSIVLSERDKFVSEKGVKNKVMQWYVIKDKARWIQECLFDNHLPFEDRLHLSSTILMLGNKYSVFGYCVVYCLRYILYHIKLLVCH